MIERRENSLSLQVFWNTLFQRKINVCKNWLRDHSSWIPCEIGMKIECILKSCFLISLHQRTLSVLCSRIQGYILSLINEIDHYIASTACFVWDAKLVFPTGCTSKNCLCFWTREFYQQSHKHIDWDPTFSSNTPPGSNHISLLLLE